MKCLVSIAVAALASASFAAGAQETTLIFTTVNPPSAHLTKNILVPWAERINERGKGVVKLDIRDGERRQFDGRHRLRPPPARASRGRKRRVGAERGVRIA